MKWISSVSETAAVFIIRTDALNNSDLALALVQWQLPPSSEPRFLGIDPCLDS
jgi:hypothetical protein